MQAKKALHARNNLASTRSLTLSEANDQRPRFGAEPLAPSQKCLHEHFAARMAAGYVDSSPEVESENEVFDHYDRRHRQTSSTFDLHSATHPVTIHAQSLLIFRHPTSFL